MRKKRSTPEGLEAARLATQRHREKIGAEGRAEARRREKVIFEGVEMTRGEKAEIKSRRAEERRQEQKALADAKRIKREEAKRQKLRDQPWTAPGLSPAEKFRLRYALDPEFNIRQRLRAAMRRKRQGYKMGDLIRAALKRGGSTPKFEDFVGYSTNDLRVHLEAQFTKGMDWNKFARGEIHIDHIVPISSFDLSDPEDLRRAWAITNLRPLWAEENLKKSSKRIYLI
jgi:5-methylcytosine-specific restriction endonuclease McrA